MTPKFKTRLRRILAEEKLGRRHGRQKPQSKDLGRMRKVVDKAMAKADPEVVPYKMFVDELVRQAKIHARPIKQWDKAERRGTALLQLGSEYGRDFSLAAEVFFDLADKLGVPAATPEPDWSTSVNNTFYVNPMGAVDLRNGNNRVFNFVEEWGGDMTTLLVAERTMYDYKAGRDKYRRIILVGSGPKGYARPGEPIRIVGDQSGREFDIAITVGEIDGPMSVDLLQRAAKMIGKQSALAYVMK